MPYDPEARGVTLWDILAALVVYAVICALVLGPGC